jgi:hypothetical protein
MIYSITCECGKEVSGSDKQNVEAEMLLHAANDHSDMFKAMSVEQLAGKLKDWDQTFATTETSAK